MPPFLTPIRLLPILFVAGTNAFSLSDLITTNFSHPHEKVVAQQNPAVIPPFPILQVGLAHMLVQTAENATEAETTSIAVSENVAVNEEDALTQCGPNSPCVDGSCCNSGSRSPC